MHDRMWDGCERGTDIWMDYSPPIAFVSHLLILLLLLIYLKLTNNICIKTKMYISSFNLLTANIEQKSISVIVFYGSLLQQTPYRHTDKVPTYQKKSTDNPTEESITKKPFEEPITEDHKEDPIT